MGDWFGSGLSSSVCISGIYPIFSNRSSSKLSTFFWSNCSLLDSSTYDLYVEGWGDKPTLREFCNNGDKKVLEISIFFLLRVDGCGFFTYLSLKNCKYI